MSFTQSELKIIIELHEEDLKKLQIVPPEHRTLKENININWTMNQIIHFKKLLERGERKWNFI